MVWLLHSNNHCLTCFQHCSRIGTGGLISRLHNSVTFLSWCAEIGVSHRKHNRAQLHILLEESWCRLETMRYRREESGYALSRYSAIMKESDMTSDPWRGSWTRYRGPEPSGFSPTGFAPSSIDSFQNFADIREQVTRCRSWFSLICNQRSGLLQGNGLMHRSLATSRTEDILLDTTAQHISIFSRSST